jgi:hypothetical protein
VRDGVHVITACYVRAVGTSRGIVVGLVLAFAACAPTVDGPREHQRTADREDADRLAAQLGALPGALSAQVTLHRAAHDPLTSAPPGAPTGVALIIVDDAADRAAIERTATTLFTASAPDVPRPAIVIEVGAHRPELARVGPFTVEAGSKGALRAVLAMALGAIALLASWIAFTARRAA